MDSTTRPDLQVASQPSSFGRFLKGAFLFAAVVAAAAALGVQQRRLNDLRTALSRYELIPIPTSVGQNQFRVISQRVFDTNHLKVFTYRIESMEEHFAKVDDGEGDSGGSTSSKDSHTGLHTTTVTIILDHLDSQKVVKLLPKVGGAQGYSIVNVPEDHSLDAAAVFHEVDGVHSRDDAVKLFEWNGRTYTLTLK